MAHTMEKIWIQFNEQDYQIYHNYCLRYYTVYDTTRKRSIQLFLELFEKDRLPVGEHDLKEVSIFFSKKCDELEIDRNILEKDNSLVNLPQFQVCRDILFLIEDFEKIYRIIQKTGVASNYFLVLAAFSKIIEEEKNAYIFAANEQDRGIIDSFAPSIAKIIRTRLGSDTGWESVLYELTRIVRKYNLASPCQKIDQNCIFLIGSAVVSHFNSDVGYEEIQSTLERYFEESELAEFESLLNNTPYLPDNDTDSDISDSYIFEALKSISYKDINQGLYETISDPNLLENTDISPVILPAVISRNSETIIPSRQTFTQHSNKIQKNYPSRFDIDVSDTVQSLVVIPEKKVIDSYYTYTKPGMPQYSHVFMGIVIIMLLAIVIAATSGIWNPVKAIGNTSTVINNNVYNLEGLRSPSAINGSGSLVGKNITSLSLATKTRMTSADLNKNFMRIAFGPDNTKIKKIADERISVAISGANNDNDTVIIEQFKDQFNNISYTNKFVDEVKSNDKGDIVVLFLPESSIKNIEQYDSTIISKNSKTGEINYMQNTIKNQLTTTEVLYINSDYKGEKRTHWILRGLLSELGLVGETDDYTDSIFYSGSENTDRLSESDLKVIGLMYSKKITTGMTFDRVKALLLV
jgi:hypothetical protein